MPLPSTVELLLNSINVERVARAMAEAQGNDPDEHRPATGYADAPLVPHWRMNEEWARRHLAAADEIAAIVRAAAKVEVL